MFLKFTTGDATRPEGPGAKIIVHICNDSGLWGAGFVLAISKRWAKPEREYRRWYGLRGTELEKVSGIPFRIGSVQFVSVSDPDDKDDLFVANLIGQHGVKGMSSKPPIRYDAVRKGLAEVSKMATEWKATIHMPRIGCGLAGGSWDKIEEIMADTLDGQVVVVYDLIK